MTQTGLVRDHIHPKQHHQEPQQELQRSQTNQNPVGGEHRSRSSFDRNFGTILGFLGCFAYQVICGRFCGQGVVLFALFH